MRGETKEGGSEAPIKHVYIMQRLKVAGPGSSLPDASSAEAGDGRGHPDGFYNDVISAQEYPTLPPSVQRCKYKG